MSLQERLLVLKHYREHAERTGALTQSSRFLARAMTQPLAAAAPRAEPIRVLEVGIGTGALTRAILRKLRSHDRVVAYEISDIFVEWMQRQLRDDPQLASARDRIEIVHGPIETIARAPAFDFVISSLPFSNFEAGAVREILEVFRAVARPGATVSFYEYLGSRSVRGLISEPRERRRLRAVEKIVSEYRRNHLVASQFVPLNVPPAWARHLQFG